MENHQLPPPAPLPSTAPALSVLQRNQQYYSLYSLLIHLHLRNILQLLRTVYVFHKMFSERVQHITAAVQLGSIKQLYCTCSLQEDLQHLRKNTFTHQEQKLNAFIDESQSHMYWEVSGVSVQNRYGAFTVIQNRSVKVLIIRRHRVAQRGVKPEDSPLNNTARLIPSPGSRHIVLMGTISFCVARKKNHDYRALGHDSIDE